MDIFHTFFNIKMVFIRVKFLIIASSTRVLKPAMEVFYFPNISKGSGKHSNLNLLKRNTHNLGMVNSRI